MKFNLLFKTISLFMLNTSYLFTRAESINECNEIKENWGNYVSQCINDSGKASEITIKGGITQDLINKLATLSELDTLSFVYVPINDELNFRPLRNLTKLHSVSFDNEKRREYDPFRVRNKLLKYFPNLTRLEFYHVIIGKSALDEIGSLTNLKSVEFYKTTFDEDATFHSFKLLSNLKYLVIESYNRTLKRVSTSLNYLTNLETLEIKANGADVAFISHSTLENLQKLRTIDITNDVGLNLKRIGCLTNLVYLRLVCENTTSLPNNIGNLKKLKELSLYGNPIKTIPDTIGDLESLEDLYLADNQIESIPESIGNLAKLKYLNLARNKITSIPSSIGNLSNLQRLSLDGNQIEIIPDSLENLEKLDHLSLENNKIKVIPDSIGNLKKLDHLLLSSNEIESIPESIGNLESLQYISLSYNKVQSVPDSIGNLNNLQYVYLDHNNITSIPESLKNLSSIRVLNTSYNPIKSE
ncbi:L domain-like protein [Anaeromyces robustus]|uniref:L domain-like protein n=1 Tax=Anaeromyces robustus TaxID=1754192 RepID=A0A1Y1VUF6_9FUNG|nr:L domain-like protein [Anaeromyces robustus]|eukprot:ORX64928.1 L domain-like protein [Anaeromyces robustus]